MSDYVRFDFEVSLREARSRMSMARVMEQHGHRPPPGKRGGEPRRGPTLAIVHDLSRKKTEEDSA